RRDARSVPVHADGPVGGAVQTQRWPGQGLRPGCHPLTRTGRDLSAGSGRRPKVVMALRLRLVGPASIVTEAGGAERDVGGWADALLEEADAAVGHHHIHAAAVEAVSLAVVVAVDDAPSGPEGHVLGALLAGNLVHPSDARHHAVRAGPT